MTYLPKVCSYLSEKVISCFLCFYFVNHKDESDIILHISCLPGLAPIKLAPVVGQFGLQSCVMSQQER